MENSALKWSTHHARHQARVDQEEDPYNATKGFWHSHCGWVFTKTRTGPNGMRSGCERILW
jgi:stearoyl-CoA desaturase (delta-9 desaturase)